MVMKPFSLLTSFTLFFTSCIFSQTPNWQWAKKAGGISDDRGSSIAVTIGKTVCVAGWFLSSPIIFDTDTLTSSDGYDIFVAKLGAVLLKPNKESEKRKL